MKNEVSHTAESTDPKEMPLLAYMGISCFNPLHGRRFEYEHVASFRFRPPALLCRFCPGDAASSLNVIDRAS